MMVGIANLSIILVILLSMFQFFIPVIFLERKKMTLINLVPFLAASNFFLLSVSFFILILSYINSDFSLFNVWSNSHTSKPLIYKISGSWGNHEGSMLLWCWVMSLYGFLVSLNIQKISQSFTIRILMFQGILCFGFVLFLFFGSNPFLILDPAPIEGVGLNPLLQDPGLAFHPPFLYLGYVGLSIVWSFALAGLFNKKFDRDWARVTRPWVLISWIFLTIGITLGSFWAYYELGWGGFWFWDPVENASLIPWIITTALFHSILVMEKRGSLANWCILLSIIAFAMSMVGTFIVRSGLITSVHAFATDPNRGIFILTLISIYIVASLSIFALRPIKADGFLKYRIFSKDFFLILNNLLLMTAVFTVFVGTVYPMVLEIFSGERISVGTPFYTITVIPIIFLISIFAPVAVFLPWGNLEVKKQYKKYITPYLLIILSSWAVCFYMDIKSIMSFIGVFVSFWIIYLSIYNYLLKFSYPTLSSFLGHVGLGLFIMGASISISSQEDFESSVRVNSSINIGGYDIDFKGVEDTKGPNYISSKGIFVVNDNDNISILNPEKRFYPVERSVTTEAAIMTNFLSHIYIVLGEKVGSEEWVIRIWYKPFISLIWIGALFAALGGVFALLNRKKLSYNVFKIVSFFIISLAIPMSTNAKTFENEIFDNATEKRIHSINQNIRCMVCESQTIDDSNSPLAKDLRSIVRDKVLNGETDIEIYDFFRKRYGDYVILKPPFRLNTYILWFTPIFIFIFGFLMIYLNQRGAKDLGGKNDP